ncbi:MAG: glucose-6-phosphate dehydrogenase, partial [Candidatus Eisenbacteria bacterium]|nr:glucose-6-phosphate dehydrogenase [Candidatus Eisenbacteria bacterium]
MTDRSNTSKASAQNETESRRKARPADPCAMVIFGAAGDLTKRLLVPALYNLSRTGVLPDSFTLVGVDLADGSTESWRDHLHDMLESFLDDADAEFDIDRIDPEVWQRLAAGMRYLQGDLTDAGAYAKIRDTLQDVEKSTQGNVIFYLAVADRFFGTVIDHLGEAGLTDETGREGWRRVIIEKP